MITREFAMTPDIASLAYDKLVDLLSVNGKIRVEGYQLLIDYARASQKSSGQSRLRSSSMRNCSMK
jgi:hypothetical protein